MKPMHIDELRSRICSDLEGKSDRDCVISFMAWVEHFLAQKCAQSAVTPKSRPPSSLKRSIDAAFDAGWIDSEL
jgi:hypothetical protein